MINGFRRRRLNDAQVAAVCVSLSLVFGLCALAVFPVFSPPANDTSMVLLSIYQLPFDSTVFQSWLSEMDAELRLVILMLSLWLSSLTALALGYSLSFGIENDSERALFVPQLTRRCWALALLGIPIVNVALLMMAGMHRCGFGRITVALAGFSVIQSVVYVQLADFLPPGQLALVAGCCVALIVPSLVCFSQRIHSEWKRCLASTCPQSGCPVLFVSDAFSTTTPDLQECLHRGMYSRIVLCIDEGIERATPGTVQRASQYLSNTGFTKRQFKPARDVFFLDVDECGGTLQADGGVIQRLEAIGPEHGCVFVIVGGGTTQECMSAVLAKQIARPALIQIPSTARAQIASSVVACSGKDNHQSSNALEAPGVPVAVINSTHLTHSLSKVDRLAGVVEAIKVALVYDRNLFEWIEQNIEGVLERHSHLLEMLIVRACHLNLDAQCGPGEKGIISGAGLGQWCVQKLQVMSRHSISYGEALTTGIAVDAAYAMTAGFLQRQHLERVLLLLSALGFPVWRGELHQRSADGQWYLHQGVDEYIHSQGGIGLPVMVKLGRVMTIDVIDRGLLEQAVGYLREWTKEPQSQPIIFPDA